MKKLTVLFALTVKCHSRVGICMFIMLLLCFSVVQLKAETTQKIRLAENLSKSDWNLIDSLGVRPDHCGGGDLYLRSSQVTLLQQRAVALSIIDDNIERSSQQRGSTAATMGGFRTLDEIGLFLDSLATLYPSIISTKDSIGATIEGRPIWVVKISDNHAIDEDEPEVFYNSLIHSREPAAGRALQRFMEYLCQNYGSNQTVTDVVNGRELYFMPVVNPDGYAYNEETNPFGGGLWRKNRRANVGGTFGVDLNRNFDFEWGQDNVGSSSNPNNETYRGTGGFSEPETQVLRDFVLSRNFKIVNNMHSYSNLFLWPWGSSHRLYTAYDDLYSIMGDSATKQNFYSATVGWLLYPTNGAADEWFWGDTLSRSPVLTFTTEIGTQSDGFWPLQSRINTLAEENIAPNLFLARVADNPYRLGPSLAPKISSVDTVGDEVTLRWQHPDQFNTAVSHDIRELRGKQQVTDGAEQASAYWSVSRMTRSTARAKTGSFSWKTQNSNANGHWLQSAQPYLVQPGDSLSFWIWYNLENDFDYFYAGVATDGASFVSLANNLTTNVDPNNANLGNGITGASNAWVRCSYSLSSYVGQYVYFRLAQITDGGSLSEGVYLDDIENIDLYSSDQIVATGLTDTITTLVDQLDGVVSYAVRTHDTEGQISPWSTYATTTVPIQYVTGDVNEDGSVDIGDLTMYVGYLFLGTPASLPLPAAEIDCSSGLDISDLTVLVDHLFISFAPIGC